MNEPQGVIRRISWRDLFPWLILLRTFRLAISPALLAVATVAVLITPLGWAFAAVVFQPIRVSSAPAALSYWQQTRADLAKMRRDAIRALGQTEGTMPPPPVAEPEPAPPAADSEPPVPWRERVPSAANALLDEQAPPAARAYIAAAPNAVVETYLDFAEPVARFFRLELPAPGGVRSMTLRDAAFYLFGTLWMLAVWSLPGGLVTRRAIVELATESPVGIRDAAEFAWSRCWGYFLAPLYPLVGVAVLTAPIAIVGLLVLAAPGVGSIVAGLLWVFVAVAGLAAMWLFVGLIFGWPLMWPAISAERDGDAFEALQRSFSYVYGKPLHYFFYAAVAAAFGALCLAVVEIAMSLVRDFGFWALSWGSGGQRAIELRTAALSFANGGQWPTGAGAIGATLVGLVVALIQAVATAFRYTFFFTAASAIYLLLRHDVDEKEMDEVWLGPRTDSPPPQPVATAAGPPVAPIAAVAVPPAGDEP